jgi:hypothetical protein
MAKPRQTTVEVAGPGHYRAITFRSERAAVRWAFERWPDALTVWGSRAVLVAVRDDTVITVRRVAGAIRPPTLGGRKRGKAS